MLDRMSCLNCVNFSLGLRSETLWGHHFSVWFGVERVNLNAQLVDPFLCSRLVIEIRRWVGVVGFGQPQVPVKRFAGRLINRIIGVRK